MVCAFPAKVLWINYVLLVPALVHNFVLLPRWHRQRYGFSAMRTKIVYAWAHLFAFRDRLTGRGFQWRPTGGSLETRPSRRLLLVRNLLVGWPLAGFPGVVAGSALHMSSPLDVDYWPPLLFACVWTTAAICVLRPWARRGMAKLASQCKPPRSRCYRSGRKVVRPSRGGGTR